MVYGDYDVDGTTAVALVYGFLSEHYPNLLRYIPDRYEEGYGVSYKGVDTAEKERVTLIISLDCGVKDIAKIWYAKEKGIDFIVCDHHLPGIEPHPAVALLNPKRADCTYPYKELSGCGVGFKLLQGFCIRQGIALDKLYNRLDLLCISIGADIVPITGENRVMAAIGLQIINKTPRPGVAALIKVSDFQKELTITNVVFGLAPRINAAGRIAHGSEAVDLLLCKSAEEAESFAFQINAHNSSRKGLDADITKEALEMIRVAGDASSTVLYKEDWHKGVVGIVASRCIEQFYRPTIVLTGSNGKATGSARSVEGFDVYSAIEACADLLHQFGGHQHAAGLTLAVENVPPFRERFESEVKARLKEENLKPTLRYSMELTPDQLTFRLYRIIQRMAPFGPGNMQPSFLWKAAIVHHAEVIKEQHLKLYVVLSEGQTIGAIGFGLAALFSLCEQNRVVDICFQLHINEYQGKQNLQLYIKDIRASGTNSTS
jgi:single-stranded-DNA-specific exonuclease